MTEAVPLATTALIPLVLFPILSITNIETTAASYAHPLIFLFLGGFLLARAMERWQLHRRIAFYALKLGGQNPAYLVLSVLGTTAFLSMWVQDEYSVIYGYTPGVVTGKPIMVGGAAGREGATGRGIGIVLQEYARHRAEEIPGKTAVIQGFGNVGSHAALDLQDRGISVISASDSSGGIFDPAGFDIRALFEHKKKTGSVLDFEGSQAIEHDPQLELQCDILVLAELGGAIDETQAASLRAQVIVEGANSPVTYDADLVLRDRGVVVLPDILANTGGVIVSYLEWVQNVQHLPWTADRINRELSEKLTKACDSVFAVATGLNCSFREAAHRIATKRLKDALWITSF